jgi:hypothetical protein
MSIAIEPSATFKEDPMIRKLDFSFISNLQPATESEPAPSENKEPAAAPIQIVHAKETSGGPNAYAAKMNFDRSAMLQYSLLGQLKEKMPLEPAPQTDLANLLIQGQTPSSPDSNLDVKLEHLTFIPAEPPIDLPPIDVVPGRDKPHLFVKDAGDTHEVDMNDVDQGMIGDCFVMASIAALARQNPEMIKNMIRENEDGTYTVTFKQGDTYAYVTVNADFPGGLDSGQHADTGDVTYYGKREIWPLVLEKAYAAYWEGGYANIADGGNPGPVLDALFGGRSSKIRPGIDESFETMKAELGAGRPYIFGTPDVWAIVSVIGQEPKKFDPDSYGLVSDHAYTLNKMYTDANGRQWVELFNPWGDTHPKPIPFDEIQTYFEEVIRGGARA